MDLLVFPERPVSKLIAALSYGKVTVSVRREYDRDKFNETIKKFGYHFDYDARAWERDIQPAFHGTPLDRAAEIGRELLAAGFPVDFPDPECQRLAIDGNYIPEQTRWVMAATAGKFTGWFVLSWSRREDYYQKARQLHGSRYNPPSVVIPPESFEEVQDFADLHDFHLSPGARRIVEEQARRRTEALVVNLESKPVEKPKPAKDQIHGVDRELLDDAFAAPNQSGG